MKKDIPSGKEELNGIDIDDIRNLETLPTIVFIDQEWGNLKVDNEGGKVTRNINQKKKSEVLQQLADVYSGISFAAENISSLNMWNIVNQ